MGLLDVALAACTVLCGALVLDACTVKTERMIRCYTPNIAYKEYIMNITNWELDSELEPPSLYYSLNDEVTFHLHRQGCQSVVLKSRSLDYSVYPPFNASIPTKLLILSGPYIASKDVDSIIRAKNFYLTQGNQNIISIHFSDKLFDMLDYVKKRKKEIIKEAHRNYPNVSVEEIRKTLVSYIGRYSSLTTKYTSHILDVAHELESDLGLDMDDLEVIVVNPSSSWFQLASLMVDITILKFIALCELCVVLHLIYKKLR